MSTALNTIRSVITLIPLLQKQGPAGTVDSGRLVDLLDPTGEPDVSGANQKQKAALKSLRGRVSEWTLEQIDDSLRPLVMQLETLDATATFELLNGQKQFPFDNFEEAGANVSYSFTLEVAKAKAEERSRFFGVGSTGVPVRVGYEGSLSGGASAKRNLSMVNFTASGSTSGDAQYDCFLAQDGGDRLAEVLARGLSNTLDPRDFNDVWRQVALEDAVAGHRLEFNGSLAIGGKISLARGWSFTADALNGLGTGGSAQLNASLSANFSLEGAFLLEASRHRGGGLRVTLTRKRQTNKGFEASLGANIMVSGLTDPATELLKTALPETPEFWEEIEQLTKPGDYIQQTLEDALVSGSGTGHSLIKLALGTETPDSMAEQLSEKVVGRLRDRVNSIIPVSALDDHDSAVEKVMDELTGILGLDIERGEEPYRSVKAEISDKLKEFDKNIDSQWRKLGSSLKKAAKQSLLEPLASVGEEVSTLKQKVDDRWDELLAPMRSFIDKYQKIRSEVFNELERYSTVEFMAQASLAYKINESRDIAIDIVIRNNTEETRRLYEAIWSGNLDSIGHTLDAAEQDVVVNDLELVSGFAGTRTLSVTYNLFGMSASWKNTRISEVSVGVGESGEVILASSKATLETAFKTSHESKTAFSALSFVGRHDSEETGISFSGYYSHADEDLEDEEIRAYFSVLEKAGLIGPGVSRRAVAAISGTSDASGKARRKAEIQTRIVIDDDTFDGWIASPPDRRTAYKAALRALLELAIRIEAPTRDASRVIDFVYADDINRVTAFLPEWNDGSIITDAERQSAFKYVGEEYLGDNIPFSRRRALGTPAGRAVIEIGRFHRYAVEFSRIFEVFSGLDKLRHELMDDSGKIESGGMKRQLKSINKRYVNALEGWISSPIRIGIEGDKVAPRFAALPMALGKVAGDDSHKVSVLSVINLPDGKMKFLS